MDKIFDAHFSLKYFKDMNSAQQRSLLVLLLDSTATAIMALIYGITSTQSFISLTISLALTIFLDRLVRYSFENKTEREINRIAMKNNNLEYIGSADKGIEWFLSNMSGAIGVKNTVFTRSDEFMLSRAANDLRRFSRAAAALIHSGCSWTDLYKPSEEEVLRSFASNLKENAHQYYKNYCLPLDHVALQCILIRYRGDDRAILFGWNGSESEPFQVYLSKYKDSCEYFLEYFSCMQRVSEEVNLTAPHRPVSTPKKDGAAMSP